MYFSEDLGRTREFDVDAALWKAVKLFWRKGYAATSISDLEQAMGVGRGSMYRTYGGKQALFAQAIARYSKYQCERIPQGDPPVRALQRWFANNIDDTASRGLPSGCLVINSAVEIPVLPRPIRDLVRRHLGQLEGFFSASVRGGQESGQVGASIDVERTAQALLSAIIGINVLSRTGASRAVLERVADDALAFIRE